MTNRIFSVFGALCLLLAGTGGASAESGLTYLEQGWKEDLRADFYFTPQGSRIMPYGWFLALESLDGQGRFSDPDHLARYGLIPPDGPHPLNPGGLPIGFTIEPLESRPRPSPAQSGLAYLALEPDPGGTQASDRFLGLTCAACHTSTVTVDGRPIRIDGAPANFDFDSFYADLAAAVSLTLFDPERFHRFAASILEVDTPTGAAALRLQFAEFEAKIAGDAAIRRPELQSGFGRVDALTQIVNAVAATDQGEPANLRAVAAPTSYPPLWLTPQLEFVQWNPIAASPIGRNGGQVLGVFGNAALKGEPQDWYSSSILLKELHALERWVAQLKPPDWDEAIFGSIDQTLAAEGAELFRKSCAPCHNMAPYRETDPAANFFGKTFIEIGRVDYKTVGTDPAYVEALTLRLVRTNEATAPLLGGQGVVPAANFFLKSVGAVIGRAMSEAGLTDEEKAALNGFRLRRTPSGRPAPYTPPSIRDLKASPLAGAWATGPYLHNGSVPTIYELLSPVAERRKVFWTGGRELDREKLGFVSSSAPGRFRFDTSLRGNGNGGHLYPSRGLEHRERMAIIEYLKTQ